MTQTIRGFSLSWWEIVCILVITVAFWYPSPQRDQWYFLLALLLPFYIGRAIFFRRLWTRTPLDLWLLAFLALGMLNVFFAPYTRGIGMLGRVVLGMATIVAFVEYARAHRKLDGLLALTIWLSLLIGVMAVGSTQWTTKTRQMYFITNYLPVIENFWAAETGFNPNEIAGALAWLVPCVGAIAIYRWRAKLPYGDSGAIAALLMAFALFLGQSRAAIIGVLFALVMVIFLLIRNRRWRITALAAVGAVTLLEVLIIANVFSNSNQARSSLERDESSFTMRGEIMSSGFAMVRDYPLTGVGMAMYRDGRVRERYPVPTYGTRILPHAHNELLQVATDMGIPGLLVFIGWHVVAGYMILVIYRRSPPQAGGQGRVIAIAVAGGLIAHTVFGLADAVTLWDRFGFVFWWLLALLSAQYTLTRIESE
ncbi:MAG: O-antigen ligase family protein [Burkholderiales bacterium]|nr:O-antigen ligase family protein [Anaerolineae bacterium]